MLLVSPADSCLASGIIVAYTSSLTW